MEQNKQILLVYNTLTRQKERFEPLNAPHVGMYVCGPTVYGDPHLGHARPAITFDIVFRYLKHLGYKVRYVRNITDVGHLEHDADEGDDKIEKKARLEQLEPMEIAQYYTNRYHAAMDALGVLRPSIEPQATGHIIEQQQLVQQIIDNGLAYESNGSIYFDIEAYNQKSQEAKNWPQYGVLSGRSLENINIHGGGMDLVFPHHECEIAQAVASQGKQMVKYWMHNNMITINGQKMGKSLGNFITLEQFFTGNHELLSQAYSPMTIRFFILSAHYRSTVDFSDEALQASQKGLERLIDGLKNLNRAPVSEHCDAETEQFVKSLRQRCYDAMNDDLMTQLVVSYLFEACTVVNKLIDHKATICAECLKELKSTMTLFAEEILGLSTLNSQLSTGGNAAREDSFGRVVDMVLELRAKAKAAKDWATSDHIRDELAALGFEVKDTKDGATWKLNR